MDNDAFKALVRERATPKTTKAIAREAVEDELDRRRLQRRRRGKRRSADDGSSSSSEEDEPTKNDKEDTSETKTHKEEPKWKELRRNKRAKDTTDDSTDTPDAYRDRAKERREGTNLDYQSTAALQLQQQSSQNHDPEDGNHRKDMSQYLGGDVEHTHLVKGLDLALAQKVRREEMAHRDPSSSASRRGQLLGGLLQHVDHHDEEIDLDQVMHQAKQQQQQQHDQTKALTHGSTQHNMEQVLQKCKVHPPTTEVGRSMWTYFFQKSNTKRNGEMTDSTMSCPTVAGLAVQRSTITFSTVAHVGETCKAWELPKEHTLAASSSLTSNHPNNTSHSGLVQWDEPLMKRIQMALDEHEQAHQTRLHAQASKRKKKRTHKDLIKSSSSPLDNNSGTNQQGHITVATSAASSNNEKEESDDSEDDIFQNVGTYVPPRIAINETTKQMDSLSPSSLTMVKNDMTKATKNVNGTKPDVSKGSIFSGLLPVAPVLAAVVKPRAQRPNANQNVSQPVMAAPPSRSHAAVIIDRDLFGLKGDPQEAVPLTAEQGFSTTNYGGGYGEEMEDEDDEEEDHDKDDTHNDYKRKKTKDSLTMGAKDYGKRDNKASHRTKNSTNDPEMM